jgi:hypothetical protein
MGKTAQGTFWRSLALRCLIGAGCIVITFFALRSALDLYRRQQVIDRQSDQVRIKMNDLDDRTEVLQKKLKTMKTKEGQEAILRELYDVGHKGEEMIVLVDTPSPRDPEAPKKKTWIGDMWEWITR